MIDDYNIDIQGIQLISKHRETMYIIQSIHEKNHPANILKG